MRGLRIHRNGLEMVAVLLVALGLWWGIIEAALAFGLADAITALCTNVLRG